jgi:hypothetical protein
MRFVKKSEEEDSRFKNSKFYLIVEGKRKEKLFE